MEEIRLQRKSGNNPQIREYTDAVRRGQKSLHVVRSSDGTWTVRSEKTKTSGQFSTRKDAVNYARDKARDSRSSMFVHAMDGRITEREDYE